MILYFLNIRPRFPSSILIRKKSFKASYVFAITGYSYKEDREELVHWPETLSKDGIKISGKKESIQYGWKTHRNILNS